MREYTPQRCKKRPHASGDDISHRLFEKIINTSIMIEKMKERRTIRKYRQEDVPESLVEELLEVASRASNTGNMQLYSVVVTRDAGMKKQLDEAHFHQPMVTEAPVVLTFCADANRFYQMGGSREGGSGIRQSTDVHCRHD